MKSPLLTALVIVGLAGACLAGAGTPAQTIKNLNTAFQGESNAANRYAKFSEVAEREGLPQVARLFRAASAAEAVHRDNHKEAIIELGGAVESFPLDDVKPGTTAENLKTAIQGEAKERDQMYPEFIAEAKASNLKAAVRTLQFALAVEKEHAELYQTALDQLGHNPAQDYFVCRVCGATLTALPEKKCPVCRNGRNEFQKIP